MTLSDACTLLVDLVCKLSDVKREGAAWRLVALSAMHHIADLSAQLEIVDRRRRVCRQRMAEQLPDATIRRQEPAP